MTTLFSLLPGAWFTDNCVVILPTGGGGSGSALAILDEGVLIDAATSSIDFVGSGVTATSTGAGFVEVTIPGAAFPPASQVGQVVFSVDGLTFLRELPVTDQHGWLVNNNGILIVNG
ncbi:MAG: hypothetical protein KAI80_04990 [Hyphomicrobiaceae bacterium]|nr:hypothetical protein [Hyphomicrobiaceae bacterium]